MSLTTVASCVLYLKFSGFSLLSISYIIQLVFILSKTGTGGQGYKIMSGQFLIPLQVDKTLQNFLS